LHKNAIVFFFLGGVAEGRDGQAEEAVEPYNGENYETVGQAQVTMTVRYQDASASRTLSIQSASSWRPIRIAL